MENNHESLNLIFPEVNFQSPNIGVPFYTEKKTWRTKHKYVKWILELRKHQLC